MKVMSSAKMFSRACLELKFLVWLEGLSAEEVREKMVEGDNGYMVVVVVVRGGLKVIWSMRCSSPMRRVVVRNKRRRRNCEELKDYSRWMEASCSF